MTSNGIALNEGNTFDFKTTVFNNNNDFMQFVFSVNVGNYYLNYLGEWVLKSGSAVEYLYIDCIFGSISYTLSSRPMPVSGNVVIKVYSANFGTNNYVYEIQTLDIVNTTNSNNGAIGEFHTVQRQNRPSSISKETIELFNGDSPSLIYEGAIYKANQTSRTNFWFRKFKSENKAILQIVGEDILRMSQKPQKLFTGDVYGFLPYLSVVTIDNVEGKFMPIEWSFDSKANITTVKLLEAFNGELTDIDYKYTLDYGNTVKPTITS